jgi:TolA-binding protein
VFAVFGKPDRSTNCDCERSSEPSLLQTVYMRNDFELLNNLERKGSWISSLAGEAKDRTSNSEKDAAADAAQLRTAQQQISRMQRRAEQLRKKDNEANKKELAKVEERLKKLRKQVVKAKAAAASKNQEKASSKPVSLNTAELVREAYLRTVSRLPTDEETARAKKHLEEAKTPVDGAKDLMWALLNTKEFIVNH